MKKYIDLHMHTLYSDDGDFTPSSIVEQCKEAGVTIMAIADHNTTAGVAEAKKRAEELGIRYIPAMEIDCAYEEINLHVVGYGIDYAHVDFKEIEENIHQQELKSTAEKIELTNKLGFSLTLSDFDGLIKNGVITGEMFAEVLLGRPEYKAHPILAPYREGEKRGDNPYVNFYWDYYSKGKPCYVDMSYPSLGETIALIKKHGGVSVLAHPGNNLKGNFEIFDDMVDLGLQGVEAFSNYHNLETSEYFYQKAVEKNILITCGSDYHGKTKPAIRLGESGCFIDEKIIEDQLKHYGLIE